MEKNLSISFWPHIVTREDKNFWDSMAWWSGLVDGSGKNRLHALERELPPARTAAVFTGWNVSAAVCFYLIYETYRQKYRRVSPGSISWRTALITLRCSVPIIFVIDEMAAMSKKMISWSFSVEGLTGSRMWRLPRQAHLEWISRNFAFPRCWTSNLSLDTSNLKSLEGRSITLLFYSENKWRNFEKENGEYKWAIWNKQAGTIHIITVGGGIESSAASEKFFDSCLGWKSVLSRLPSHWCTIDSEWKEFKNDATC